jgi:hypothetical protein
MKFLFKHMELIIIFQGDRLDENDLIINDADNINTNTYSVRLLNDSCSALNLTYDIISIDHPKRPPSTAIYASKIY